MIPAALPLCRIITCRLTSIKGSDHTLCNFSCLNCTLYTRKTRLVQKCALHAQLGTSLQAAMATDRLERESALTTIAQLRHQQRQLQADQESHLPRQDAIKLTQHVAELDKQVADLASSNDELSTDLERALDVAQRVMDQKSKLQEQCQNQEQQLMQWQAEAQRVKELEGSPLLLSVSSSGYTCMQSCSIWHVPEAQLL